MPRADGVKQINLVGRKLPRGENGDVKFATPEDLYEHFTQEEVVVLCERAIYHMEYQRDHHKKYTQRIRDIEKPVKAMAKKMFPGIAWINLTEEQVGRAAEAALKKEE